jgi:hypothetical protein
MSTQSAVASGNSVLFLLAMVSIVFSGLSSCASRETAEVRTTVERFISALYAGDRKTLTEIAPEMVRDEKLEQVFSAIAKYPFWSITELSRRGGSARARIKLHSEGQGTEILIPLSLNDGNWTVDDKISVTTQLDLVVPQR